MTVIIKCILCGGSRNPINAMPKIYQCNLIRIHPKQFDYHFEFRFANLAIFVWNGSAGHDGAEDMVLQGIMIFVVVVAAVEF